MTHRATRAVRLQHVPETSLRSFAGAPRPVLSRAGDVIASAAALLLLAPALGLVAVAIRIEARGPILCRHRRLAGDGRVVWALRFRTARAGAEGRTGTPRATAVGRVLRRTCLDELPQLWNVLRGDIALGDVRAARGLETARSGSSVTHGPPRR